MAQEFAIISQYFAPLGMLGDTRKFIVGQGDDCAVLSPDPRPLALSIDTQIAEVHFFASDEPEQVASRGFNCALSDLAAMGATPAFFTLALTLPPELDEGWIGRYAKALARLAHQWRIPLIGGDTTTAPLLVQTFQVHGYLDQPPLTRKGARPGDLVVVSGTLGDAAAALCLLKNRQQPAQALLKAFYAPSPQIILGQAIAPWATACIDISDGLLADLGHLCLASGVGADVQWPKIPLSEDFRQAIAPEDQIELAMSGGDDYGLCFTVPPQHWDHIAHLPVTAVGQINNGSQITLTDQRGQAIKLAKAGYQHL